MEYTRKFRFFFCFVLLNLVLYFFIYQFNGLAKFDRFNYINDAYHYISDPRINGGKFELLPALGQYDAQWYLRIADKGYPDHPQPLGPNDKLDKDALSYAFFPGYPLLLGLLNRLLGKIEFSAFVLTILLLLVNYWSFYYVVGSLLSFRIALKTIFLLFLFPVSIFLRSYFAEGLFLFFLIWFVFFWCKKRFLSASIIFGLTLITKGNGLLLLPIFFYDLYKNVLVKKSYKTFVLSGAFTLTPLFVWTVFDYIHTGDPLYFYHVQGYWSGVGAVLSPLLQNFWLMVNFIHLPLQSFHYARIEAMVAIMILILLIKAWGKLPKKFWLLSFCLWLGPLLVKDLMSFSRLQIVSFPLAVYVASQVSGHRFVLLLLLCAVGLFLESLLFINWYWLG